MDFVKVDQESGEGGESKGGGGVGGLGESGDGGDDGSQYMSEILNTSRVRSSFPTRRGGGEQTRSTTTTSIREPFDGERGETKSNNNNCFTNQLQGDIQSLEAESSSVIQDSFDGEMITEEDHQKHHHHSGFHNVE